MRLRSLETLLPREITGRAVLFSIVGFFAVIVAVNATMATLAITTFGGVETRNAYHAGLSFSREIAAARAQEARKWQVDAKVSPWTPEGVTVDLVVKDAGGRSISGAEFSVTFTHPANRREDHIVTMREIGAGAYRGHTEIAPGQRDLVVEAARDGERLFRSINRITIR
jgi:nitrogen fixation protein FixH